MYQRDLCTTPSLYVWLGMYVYVARCVLAEVVCKLPL